MLLRLLVSSYISVSIRRWVVKNFQFLLNVRLLSAFVAITTVAIIVVIVVTLLVCRCFKF